MFSWCSPSPTPRASTPGWEGDKICPDTWITRSCGLNASYQQPHPSLTPECSQRHLLALEPECLSGFHLLSSVTLSDSVLMLTSTFKNLILKELVSFYLMLVLLFSLGLINWCLKINKPETNAMIPFQKQAPLK